MSMLKKIPQNLGWLILSAVAAIIVWIIVIGEVDPTISRSFSIPVEFTGEEIATERGVLVTPIETTIGITVSQARSIVSTLSDTDFKAVADYNRMYQDTQVPVTVTSLNTKISTEDIVLDKLSVEVSVTEINEINKVIECEAVGTPADGYTLGLVSANPTSVTISGPEDFLDTINKVTATIDVTGVNETKTASAELKFLDASGNELDISSAKAVSIVGDSVVSVNAEILIVQTIPIRVEVKDINQLPTGYSIGMCKTDPMEVKLYGKSEIIKKISEIVINDISVAGATIDIERKIDLRTYLPEGAMIYEGENEIPLLIQILNIPSTTAARETKKAS